MYATYIFSIAALFFGHGSHAVVVAPNEFNTNNLCGKTTWQSETTPQSPLASDCLSIAEALSQDNTDGFNLYDWEAGDDYLGISTDGTCTFGIKILDYQNHAAFGIANKDVADIIKDAHENFTVDGRIGASGEMKCHYWHEHDNHVVGWRIFSFGT
jgi:myo-inositol-hexaphosphate 3-phosphohydrolase